VVQKRGTVLKERFESEKGGDLESQVREFHPGRGKVGAGASFGSPAEEDEGSFRDTGVIAADKSGNAQNHLESAE
jgi:hypothetical protein